MKTTILYNEDKVQTKIITNKIADKLEVKEWVGGFVTADYFLINVDEVQFHKELREKTEADETLTFLSSLSTKIQ